MSVNQARYRLGLALYVLSFFLIATADPKGSPIGRLTGYECAYLAVESAVTDTPFSSNNAAPAISTPLFLYLSVLISGLINPVFLVYVTLASFKRAPQAARVLKFAIFSMIPFCWVVFYFLGVYPREGHVLWLIAMLLVLLSSWKQAPSKPLEEGSS
jgi:hypothetical protein